MAELELKHIVKDYKLENKTKFTALTDINLSFDKGRACIRCWRKWKWQKHTYELDWRA